MTTDRLWAPAEVNVTLPDGDIWAPLRSVLAKLTARSTPQAAQHLMFDRFAAIISAQVSKAWFFAACAGFILLWALTGPIMGFSDTWQLIVNTSTTIVTFLMVALLQNTEDRGTRAMQHKLDALALALADVLDNTDRADQSGERALALRHMVGVEMEPSE